MYFALPQVYREAQIEDLQTRIEAVKRKLGKQLLVLCHHYQRLEVVAHADHVGDSYNLAKIGAANTEAEVIAFCGVHFMAEAAYILAKPHQHVYLPNPLAGCPMADMADIPDVFAAWRDLAEFGGAERIMPVSYMNSAAALKCFVGENGGLICTSSNAAGALKWAFEKRQKVFFFPDQHLGYNTARKMGVTDDQMVIWDYTKNRGGLSDEQIERARIILWKGHCHVHINFTAAMCHDMRAKHPGIKIVAHPECPWEVVELSDAVGSTKFIVEWVHAQAPGTTVAIGTELNLIHRLAHERPDLTIMELSGATCPVCANMYRTTVNDLAYCLERYADLKPITVSDRVKTGALVALNRMLEIT